MRLALVKRVARPLTCPLTQGFISAIAPLSQVPTKTALVEVIILETWPSGKVPATQT